MEKNAKVHWIPVEALPAAEPAGIQPLYAGLAGVW